MEKFIVSRVPRKINIKKRKADKVNGDSAGCPIPRSKKSNNPTLPKLHQMFLDYGQKSFGKHVECSLCGMLYVIGDTLDEHSHKLNCSKTHGGLTLNSLASLKEHVILCRYGVGDEDFVAEMKRPSSGGYSDTVLQLIQIVGNDLGSSAGYTALVNEVVYVYVSSGKKIVGCLVAEEVSVEQLVALSATVKATDVTVNTVNSTNSPNSSAADEAGRSISTVEATATRTTAAAATIAPKTTSSSSDRPRMIQAPSPLLDSATRERPRPPILGVKQIWVHAGSRRNSVASRLLDNARKTFAFGSIVLKKDVAFSQPTDDGLAFALSYSGSHTIWGYS